MSERTKFPVVIALVFILICFWSWNVIALSGKPDTKKNARELYVKGLKEIRKNRLEEAEGYLRESFDLKRHSLVAYLLSLIYAENEDKELSRKYAREALEATPQLKLKYRKTANDILYWASERNKGSVSVSIAPGLSTVDESKKDVVKVAAEKEKKKNEQQTELRVEDLVQRAATIPEKGSDSLKKKKNTNNMMSSEKIEFESPNINLWPYSEFAYAKAYLYNLENKLRGNHAIIKENKLDPTVVGEGVLLTPQQAETVAVLSNLDIGGLSEELSKSYIPHHGIVFYNQDNKPVANITFCFDCEALSIFPPGPFEKTTRPLSDQKRKELLEIMGQYKSIILQLKLPVFNSPFGYQEYWKKKF